METQELIKNYKLPCTPMEENDHILALYKDYKETGFLEPKYLYNLLFINPLINTHSPTSEKFFAEKKSRLYIQLFIEFSNKWEEKRASFAGFQKATVFEKTKEVINELLVLDPEYITFELTEDCSVFFQTLVNDKNIYLELFFTKEVQDEVEVITNIYQDGKNVFAFGGSIQDVFNKIETRVSQHHWYIEQTASFYEISEPPFAETTIQANFLE